MTDPSETLTTAQVARILGISVSAVTRMLDSGGVAGVTRTPGGHRRVPRAAIEQLMASVQRSTQPPIVTQEVLCAIFKMRNPALDHTMHGGTHTNPHVAALFASWVDGFLARVTHANLK